MQARPTTRPARTFAAALVLGLALQGCTVSRGRRSTAKPRRQPAAPSAHLGPASPNQAQVERTLDRLIEGLATQGKQREGAVAALVALGPAARPALARAFSDRRQSVRLGVVAVLARAQWPERVGLLLRALEDPSENVRLEAVRALGDTKRSRVARALLDRYRHEPDPQVRYECLTSPGRIGDPVASRLLVLETENRDPYARMWAMDALCTMEEPHAPELALRLLHDSNLYVRRHVLAACARALDTPAGHGALIQVALSARDFASTVWARRDLMGYISKRGRRADALRARMEMAARAALAREGGFRAAFVLGDLRDAAATNGLLRALKNAQPLVRHHAAYLLGRVGERRAVPALVRALRDRHPLVAATAYDSLRLFAERGDQRARSAVERYKGPRFRRPAARSPQDKRRGRQGLPLRP